MKMNFNKIAKKAHGGDKEALTILVLDQQKTGIE